MTADGSNDALIKLQGLDSFTFNVDDAKRDALTGELVADAADVAEEEVQLVADAAAAASDNEEEEVFSENDGTDSEEGGETTDVEDGPPFACPIDMEVVEEAPCTTENSEVVGHTIAHRYDEGWFIGKVTRKVTMSTNCAENGTYAVKYPDSRKEFFHYLFIEDYGIEKMWVRVK